MPVLIRIVLILNFPFLTVSTKAVSVFKVPSKLPPMISLTKDVTVTLTVLFVLLQKEKLSFAECARQCQAFYVYQFTFLMKQLQKMSFHRMARYQGRDKTGASS